MDIKELIEEGLGFESGSTNQKYKTDLTGKVREIKKDTLSDEVVSSFLNGEYKTYITIDEIILYRTYGIGYSKNKGAVWNGGYASTEFAESRIDVKIRLAVKPEWLNTRLVEEKNTCTYWNKNSCGISRTGYTKYRYYIGRWCRTGFVAKKLAERMDNWL